MSGETKTPTDAGEGTRVDLGDDLLEGKTLFIPGLTPEANPKPVTTSEDLFQSATILINEGLTEEAKKLLRQIIRDDPAHVAARKTLGELQERELKQIVNEESPRRKMGAIQAELPISSEDAERVLKKLEEDLGLSAFGHFSLFQDRGDMDSFAAKLDGDLAQVSAQDRLDIGIAFLEMELVTLAVRQFQSALEIVSKTSADERLMLSAVSLLAYALILDDRAFEAMSCLQPPLRDPEIARENKIEIFYLMGRACENLKQIETGQHWYHQVVDLNPDYRDVKERLGRVRK